MNKIKTVFKIKDLENISGIKAHTIRIWEKRFNLFVPDRASRNIRYYSLDSLKKLLNIDLLVKSGVKISIVASLSDNELIEKAREIVNVESKSIKALNGLKLSMISYDASLFYSIYNELTTTSNFRDIYKNVFVPFLSFVGKLWQTDTITPSHEHFISNLIYQKIQVNIEAIQHHVNPKDTTVYVLFLPESELHEIGLLYIQYELLRQNKKVIYLGREIPINDLVSISNLHEKICFVSYYTIAFDTDLLTKYINELCSQLQNDFNTFWFIRNSWDDITILNYPSNTSFFSSIENILESM